MSHREQYQPGLAGRVLNGGTATGATGATAAKAALRSDSTRPTSRVSGTTPPSAASLAAAASALAATANGGAGGGSGYGVSTSGRVGRSGGAATTTALGGGGGSSRSSGGGGGGLLDGGSSGGIGRHRAGPPALPTSTSATPRGGEAAAAAAAGVPTTPGSSSMLVQSNALFNQQEGSMTPSVRRDAYAPSLSPEDLLLHQQQQQQQQLEAAAAAAAAKHARAAAAPPSRRGPAAAAAAKPARSFLPTTGDLFHLPDQDAEPLVVSIAGTQLVSPAWNQSRPWLTGAWVVQRPREFLKEAGGSAAAADGGVPPLRDLAGCTPAQQEALLVDDLLTVFMGQAGQYVRAEPLEGPTWPRLGFRVAGATDAALAEQVERLLPLCECVHVVKRFVETRGRVEHGGVAQALAAAMRRLQEEWWLLVVQLEHQQLRGQLSLAALVYYAQAPAASMQLLASIAGDAADQPNLTSAGLLNLLAARQRALAGDRLGQQLVGQLLEAAAAPYFAILRGWLVWGALDDPYHEFMVKEDPAVGRDSLTPDGDSAFWSQRYRLRGALDGGADGGDAHDVPEFLASSKEAILVTGKYLNVIRQCGRPVPPVPEATVARLRYDAAAAEALGGAPPFLQGVQEALHAAARALLDLVNGPDVRLTSWLHALKHIFLLDQGDLLVHLMESAEADLALPPAALAPHQLQGLLDGALRSSSVAASPHIDVVGEGALAAVMDKRSILQLVTAATCASSASAGGGGGSIAAFEAANGGADADAAVAALRDGRLAYSSGWELLLLSVRLTWPLSLVVSRRQLLAYQALFKQLLALRHAERQLGRAWQAMRGARRLGRADQARFRPWHLLCSSLTAAVGEVLRYTSIDVLEPLWQDMAQQLARAGNVDEVIALHNAFLAAALERSLLTQAEVVRHVAALLGAAQQLAKEAAALVAADAPQGASHGGAPPPPSRPASSRGGAAPGAGGRPGSGGGGGPAAESLRLLAAFAADPRRQAQLAKLQGLVGGELRALVAKLEAHYRQLLLAAPSGAGGGGGVAAGVAAGAGDLAAGLAGLGLGGWAAGAARGAVGDSSRELASLDNLIQRLSCSARLGGGGGGASGVAAGGGGAAAL